MFRRIRFSLVSLPLLLTACADPNKKTDVTPTEYSYTPAPTAKTSEPAPTPSYTATYTPATTTGSGGGSASYVSDPSTTYYAPATPPGSGSGSGSSTMRVVDEPMSPKKSSARSSSGARSSGRSTYTVKKGDTLSEIAQREYGDASKWPRIYNANKSRIADPKKLQIGTKLIIP